MFVARAGGSVTTGAFNEHIGQINTHGDASVTMGESIFEKLGGAENMAAMVKTMYTAVLKDPELAPFFKDVDVERLQTMQFEFLASAFGGPVSYSGSELQAIHSGRGITAHHFAIFVGHMADAMRQHGASADDVDAMLGQMSMYRDKIIGAANVDG
ncbi:MAG: group 1 truncated hemoglobin [Pirellulaceae bacterium]